MHIDDISKNVFEKFGIHRAPASIYVWAHRNKLPRKRRGKGGSARVNFDDNSMSMEERLEVVLEHHPKAKVRHCLRCVRKFISEHAGVRICSRCKSNSDYNGIMNSQFGEDYSIVD